MEQCFNQNSLNDTVDRATMPAMSSASFSGWDFLRWGAPCSHMVSHHGSPHVEPALWAGFYLVTYCSMLWGVSSCLCNIQVSANSSPGSFESTAAQLGCLGLGGSWVRSYPLWVLAVPTKLPSQPQLTCALLQESLQILVSGVGSGPLGLSTATPKLLSGSLPSAIQVIWATSVFAGAMPWGEPLTFCWQVAAHPGPPWTLQQWDWKTLPLQMCSLNTDAPARFWPQGKHPAALLVLPFLSPAMFQLLGFYSRSLQVLDQPGGLLAMWYQPTRLQTSHIDASTKVSGAWTCHTQ